MTNGKKRLTTMKKARGKDSEKKPTKTYAKRERERAIAENTVWVIKIKVIEG
jgi:hypothetical protein